MAEGRINQDKAGAPLGVLLYSALTQAERFPLRIAIQTLPRGTVTSRVGEREKKKGGREKRNEKKGVSTRKREKEGE